MANDLQAPEKQPKPEKCIIETKNPDGSINQLVLVIDPPSGYFMTKSSRVSELKYNNKYPSAIADLLSMAEETSIGKGIGVMYIDNPSGLEDELKAQRYTFVEHCVCKLLGKKQ